MDRLFKCLFVLLVLAVVAAPAYSSEIVQIWQCEMEGDTTEVDVEEMAKDFLKAVRQLENGEGYGVRVFHPVAVSNTGNTDFYFVFSSPTFTDWGRMWDAYNDDSPMAKTDDKHQGKVVCPDSAIWEAVNIEVD